MFSVLQHYQADLCEPNEPHLEEFAFRDDAFERWMLKLFWGGVAAGTLGDTGKPVRSLRADVDPELLAYVLFRW